MSRPSLLLVDDSKAVLAYETAALGSAYSITTATNGEEALVKLRAAGFAAVLLDLSMPGMNGEQVLAHMRSDPALAAIPVVIVSSEQARGQACLAAGAATFLAKPVRAEDLRRVVDAVLTEVRRREAAAMLTVLPMTAGGVDLAVPLEATRIVVMQPATTPLPLGPRYLCEMFDLHGEPTCVLDLPERLGLAHTRPLVDRKLVVIARGQVGLALCVDDVHDPASYAPDRVVRAERVGGSGHPPLDRALVAIVDAGERLVPVVDPDALLSAKLLRSLPDAIRRCREQSAKRAPA